jgi:hypothetical protein
MNIDINKPLCDDPMIRERLNYYELEFTRREQELQQNPKQAEAFLAEATEWKYSIDDCFEALPYRNEVLGFSPGRILKRAFANTDEASLKDRYAAGFSAGKHVVTRQPSGKLTDVIQITHFTYEAHVQRFVRLTGYRGALAGKPDVLRAIGEVKREEEYILDVGYGQGRNFSTCLLLLDKNRRVQVEYAYGKGWSGNAIYYFQYGSGDQLIEVSNPGRPGLPNIVVWKAKSL